MIRGAIDNVQPTEISGWLYSKTQVLRDHVVLAFVGARCIGSGKVDVFRKDLKDAGLGDGYCGFHFALHPVAGEELAAVVIRLQGSDLSLLQTSSKVVAGA